MVSKEEWTKGISEWSHTGAHIHKLIHVSVWLLIGPLMALAAALPLTEHRQFRKLQPSVNRMSAHSLRSIGNTSWWPTRWGSTLVTYKLLQKRLKECEKLPTLHMMPHTCLYWTLLLLPYIPSHKAVHLDQISSACREKKIINDMPNISWWPQRWST